MSAYVYTNPTVANGNSASAFKAWLDDCKAADNNFLSDLTISLTGTGSTAVVRITDSEGNYFEHYNITTETNPAQSNNEGYVTYHNQNFSMSKHDNYYDGWHRCYIVGAILNDNGLFITAAFDVTSATSAPTAAANKAIGLFGLVKDTNGKLGAVMRNITVNNRSISDSATIILAAGDSTGITTITLSPVYNSVQTGLIPIIINAELSGVTFPAFFTSLQTQLPSLGLQEGRMDSSDYITNGYCFIRD